MSRRRVPVFEEERPDIVFAAVSASVSPEVTIRVGELWAGDSPVVRQYPEYFTRDRGIYGRWLNWGPAVWSRDTMPADERAMHEQAEQDQAEAAAERARRAAEPTPQQRLAVLEARLGVSG